jgi:hypothetical protein
MTPFVASLCIAGFKSIQSVAFMAFMGLLFNYLFMQKCLANQSINFVDIFPFSKWFSSMIINFQRKNAQATLWLKLTNFVQ